MESAEAETLLIKLRESRLSTEERRTALDPFRQTLETLPSEAFLFNIRSAIRDGPNDVRRIALQTLVLRIDTDLFKDVADDSVRAGVNELIGNIESSLRTTLKVHTSRSLLAPPWAASDIHSLSTSALRATAAALKALHALIRISPRTAKHTSLSTKAPNLVSLFDIILPCLSAGTHTRGSSTASISRSSSTLQADAFSWNDSSRQARSHPTRKSAFGTLSTSSSRNDDHLVYSSAGETDRKSDKSESERSDFSTASIATTSSRTRKDESRQQEAMTKLIRQNALHCLVELNRLESRALISRWSDLLPDQPATSLSQDRSTKQTSMTSRFSASSNASAPFSLCTLITQDPSTSVRLAAMVALESILSHGSLQLSMAQERAQRALSFTSLSSQLAGWIVNIRSYLVVALQRAATAPRASARAEGTAEVVGYPSSLTTALLQLTRTFAASTAKAKLVSPNASVLGPVVMPFASHNDPQVQATAKRSIATLTPPPSKLASGSTTDAKTQAGSILASTSTADERSRTGGIGAPTETMTLSSAAPMELANLLSEGVEPSSAVCERALTAFEAADDLLLHLPSWSIFVKCLADVQAPLLDHKASTRLVLIWKRLYAQQDKTPNQQCAILSTVPDLFRALSRDSALDTDTSTSTSKYVEGCCFCADEAVRAAAVRVLGLLVLPSDSVINPSDEHHRHIVKILDGVLWGDQSRPNADALHDSSSLVRQRASWAFSNAVEARLRSHQRLEQSEWIAHARYCLEAGKDTEGVAVSACRASGILLALLTSADVSSETCRSLGRPLLEQLCRVLGTTSKPPKSRWNAASALDRALGSDVVLTSVLDPVGSFGDELIDRIVELLCSNLDAKVFKIRVSAANALVSLCTPTMGVNRVEVLGEQRIGTIRRVAVARRGELDAPASSKESALYYEELKRLLNTLIASLSASAPT